jgi:hypothetical protein
MMSEGRLQQLIIQKRLFLRQTTKDYSAGGNDMLDDVEAALQEAKSELANCLQVVNCLLEDEGQEAWLKESSIILNEWIEKWFGKP